MKAKALLVLTSALFLAACGTGMSAYERNHRHGPGEHHHDHMHGDMSAAQGKISSYSCENGLQVGINHVSNDQVELYLDHKRAVLSSAVAGSGERYVSNSGLFGKATEWHEKNGDAVFSFIDPYGNRVETSCRAR